MTPGQLTVIGVVIVGFALVSRRVERGNVTMPIVMVGCGWLTATVGWVELDLDIEPIVLLGEVALAVILFSDAERLDVSALRADLGLPLRLLGFGLPLSIAFGTAVVATLIPDLGLWEAALVSAVLAPTDAALGQAVVENPTVPIRIRQGLNVESGLNDGLVLPAVLLFLALASGEDAQTGFWVRFASEQIGLGLLIGVAVGGLGGWLMERARSGGWVDGIEAQIATLGLALTAYSGALAVGANGFLAAFVAGLAYGAVLPDATADRVTEYTQDSGILLATVSFFIFGNVLLHDHLTSLSPAVLACVVVTLTVGRILPVAVAMATLRPALPTILFVGWFGPRGLASILFGLVLLEEELAEADRFFAIIAWTVLASVVLHGVTAGPGANRYGRWFASMDESEVVDMAEAGHAAPMRRLRRR
jgi:NhaP-type Na+/H+ or K+/H+ antiporter